jgi:hypothetical protein
MPEILAAIPQVAALVEKAGVIGLLIAAVVVLAYERMRLLRDLKSAYNQRDRWRLACVKYRAACDNAVPPIHVDVSDLADLSIEPA